MIVKSAITGSVREILVAVGQDVGVGEELLTIESMKMEIPVESPQAGRVRSILVSLGASVEEGESLVELE